MPVVRGPLWREAIETFTFHRGVSISKRDDPVETSLMDKDVRSTAGRISQRPPFLSRRASPTQSDGEKLGRQVCLIAWSG